MHLTNASNAGFFSEACFIIHFPGISTLSSEEIQENVYHFINTGTSDQQVHTKAFYVSIVAEAIGIHREDKFKTYAQWGDLERILKDANEHVLDSPFDKGRIIEVLQAVFVKSASE